MTDLDGGLARFWNFRPEFDENLVAISRGARLFQPVTLRRCLKPMLSVAAMRSAFRFPKRVGPLAYPVMPGGVAHHFILLEPIFIP